MRLNQSKIETMKLLFTVLLFAIQLPLLAQKKTITGKITNDLNNEPLTGASVIIQSTREGVTTNDLGIFSIEANPNDVLLISMIGYQSVSVKINGRDKIDVKLTPSASSLEDIVLVGSRGAGRSKIETTVPVDVVNLDEVSKTSAKMGITSILNSVAPSFNNNKQSGSDGADHINIATLRGMSPDQTLVLINGKRRHPASAILLFGTRGTGSSGIDLNAITEPAIDRIEILRDGASAQYGSDAVAGVINFVLKKDVGKLNMDVGLAAYHDPKFNPAFAKGMAANQYIHEGKLDGQALNVNMDGGVALGKRGGFIHLSGTMVAQGKSYRQSLESEDPTAYWYLPVNFVRRANGNGSYTNAGGFFNMEVPVGTGKTGFYAFGGYNYNFSDDYAYSRRFSSRPDRFPTTSDGKFIPIPGITYFTSGPGGVDTVFNPHIQTKIQDGSLAAGVKGEMAGGWIWDLSNSVGQNDFHFFGDKTLNASLGPDKTHFDDGGFNFLQNTTNLNFSKFYSHIQNGMNLAFGAEFRYEKYKLYAGEADSYMNYDPTKEKDGGAQGFPGYQPNDAVNTHRTDIAAYADAELDITDRWLVDGAIRAENYSDFGFTSNYKLAGRFKATDNFNIRGSVSTGFRAPSLQQINFSSTLTAFQGSEIVSIKISPNYSPVTRSAGIPPLKQEKSVNGSLGFTWKPIKGLLVTLDGYLIKVKDRIVLSGQFDADDNTLDPALIAEMLRTNVTTTQFFANAVNTTNKGIDIVLDYKTTFGKQRFNALFAGNFQKMNLNKINVPSKLDDTQEHRNTFFSKPAQGVLLASAPETKFSLNLDYGVDKFGFGVHFTYFGKISLIKYGDDGHEDPPMIPTDDGSKYVKAETVYKGKITTDLFASYRINETISVFAGVDNIFNVHPDLGAIQGAKDWTAFDTQSGGPWDAVQMGENGRRYFLRLAFSFGK